MPEITIKLDRERKLQMDANVLADAEGAIGEPILPRIGLGKLGIREIRALLWAGLRREDNDLTLEAAGEMISRDSLPKISKALNKALDDFFAPKN